MTILLDSTPRREPGLAQHDHLPVGGNGHSRVVVLIPAHNEASTIDATVASLRRQTRPPERIIVIADNCADDTEDLGLLHGAAVMATVGNRARKAGALNQALRRVLPRLQPWDYVLIMDADSQLNRDWIRRAVDALTRDRRLGGVCGTYTGEPGPGTLLQLQRNEFVRASRMIGRRSDLWVLSGTGTMFRASVLRHIARERGRTLPGIPGEFYSSTSVTEDYEITLALKSLGLRCLCAPGCTASTELMPTWRHLFRQRLRWQSGTLTALRRYVRLVTAAYAASAIGRLIPVKRKQVPGYRRRVPALVWPSGTARHRAQPGKGGRR